ncbi:ABC transporter permease (plasmid) [Streptomyces sp. NBC_01216]|uniref:ABC transporter permease n=1 Tax=Streptomyces sp. NBC_01216 TaxID=2903778 RepID=UPI002E1368E2|nr:ABC transporter permease [Streptomyces sp. NBC_01216]
MGAVRAGFLLQLRFYRHYPDLLVPLLTAPLYSGIFTMIMSYNGRTDLAGAASLAPFYMSLWWFALFSGGWIIQTDRWEGTLEYVVAAPADFAAVVFGRIGATTLPGFAAFAETWLFARYVLGSDVTVRHWGVFLGSFALTLLAMAATALLMAAAFVLARNAVTLSNSISFPFYVLGGILVPVALLPGWLQPLSKAVFLSWSADLLRAGIATAPVPHPIRGMVMIALLGAVALAAGHTLLRRILGQVRSTGELGLR